MTHQSTNPRDPHAARIRPLIATALAACLGAGMAGPLPAAPLAVADADDASGQAQVLAQAGSDENAAGKIAAHQCLGDLRDFDSQMQKYGYWLNGAAYGFGYPMYGYGDGQRAQVAPSAATSTAAATGYWRARPGYEIRTLIASADILAQRGQQPACEALLTAARDIYNGYLADLNQGEAPRVDSPGWRHDQIGSARPVATGSAGSAGFRSSDQLVGTDVVNPQSESLGSVEDVVLSPQTGRIEYLVINRGGMFGVDPTYVPVPWQDFRSATGSNLLVLDATIRNMDSAPQLMEREFSAHGGFGKQSAEVDDYWKAQQAK